MSAAVKRKRDQEPAPGHSILNSEDVAFPRGGSTVLTPLEIKQAASEATRDLLDAPKRKKSKGGSKQQGKPGSNASSTKVESLSFSRVVPGSIVLGQIVEINKYDMVLSLANNLLGYISLTRISGKLTELLEKSTAESDDEIDDEDTEQEKEEQGSEKDSTQEITTALEELFHVGQWLRAVVVVDSSKDRKKHIDLSIDPVLVNEQIQDDDLIPGIALQASVTSVEDHGVILDIGKPARSGFISKKELQLAEIDLQSLKPGSVQLLTIVSSKRTITLSALAQPKKISTVNGLSDIHSLLPGTLIDLLITEIRSNGIFGKVFGMIDATVDIVQSGALSFPKLQELYKEGMSIKARVLFLSPKEDKISVSLLPNILSLKGDDKPLDEYPVGHFVECKVLYVDSTSGLYVDIGASHTGFIHISRVSDKRIDDLSTMSQYNPGTIHKGRILGFSFADSLYIISTEQKILDQKYLSIRDVKIGEVVRGQVERILPKGGILVKLSDGLSALASENHLSDIKLVNPEKKFKLGMKVTGRVC